MRLRHRNSCIFCTELFFLFSHKNSFVICLGEEEGPETIERAVLAKHTS